MRIKKPPFAGGRGFSLLLQMGEDEVFLGDGNGQAGAVGVAGFFQQGRDKALYGAGGDAQLCGDLLIFQPLAHQPQHLDLPGVSWVLLTCPRRVSGVRSG